MIVNKLTAWSATGDGGDGLTLEVKREMELETTGNIFDYDNLVKVSAESGEVLGMGHFVGGARINRITGRPGWSGDLHTSVDPIILVASGLLSVEFENGAIGHARCTNASINARSERGALFLVRLMRQGEPPPVEAGSATVENGYAN